jgi:drug/metabolite transporter (DMT)-like permease
MSLMVSVLYGASPIIYKHVENMLSYKVSNYTLLLISSSVFFACTLICYFIHSRTITNDLKMLSNNINTLLLLVISSVFSVFVANLLYFHVLQRRDTQTYIISALVFTCPLFTLILSYLFLKEEITKYTFTGICFIVIGVLTLTLSPPSKTL